MAARTIARDIAVIEYGRNPPPGLVAVVTLIAGNDVIRCFAGCNNAVVAGHAAACHSRMVHKSNRAPCSRSMAVCTDLRTRNMIHRPRGRLHGANRGVTTDTSRIRALERAAGMASITTYIGMCTVKLKPGAEMIEWCLCRCGRKGCSKQQVAGGKRENSPNGNLASSRSVHWIDLTSRNESAE